MTSLLEAVAFDSWILHVLVWGPMAAMLHVLLEDEERSGHIAFGWTLGLFAVSLGLWGAFTVGDPGFQMASSVPWIEAWGEQTGWLIRGTMIGVGALLWFVPAFLGDNQAECEPQSE